MSTTDVPPPSPLGDDEDAEPVFQRPIDAGHRFGVGMPVAHSKDLRGSTRRLVSYLGPERTGAVIALVLAIMAVVLAVSGPRLLGHATNIIVDGVTSGQHEGWDCPGRY